MKINKRRSQNVNSIRLHYRRNYVNKDKINDMLTFSSMWHIISKTKFKGTIKFQFSYRFSLLVLLSS